MTQLYDLTAIRDLAQRCKSATGPDREIDGRIWAELDGRDVREGTSCFGERSVLAKSRRAPHDECVVGVIDRWGVFFTVGQSPEPPRVTGSIDAAMAMVERVLGVDTIDIECAKRYSGSPSKPMGRAEICGPDCDAAAIASTPALALCAALIAELIGRDEMTAHAPLCSDCPPAGYPTDETRCTCCPRRGAEGE